MAICAETTGTQRARASIDRLVCIIYSRIHVGPRRLPEARLISFIVWFVNLICYVCFSRVLWQGCVGFITWVSRWKCISTLSTGTPTAILPRYDSLHMDTNCLQKSRDAAGFGSILNQTKLMLFFLGVPTESVSYVSSLMHCRSVKLKYRSVDVHTNELQSQLQLKGDHK